jgi:hypothetical protein
VFGVTSVLVLVASHILLGWFMRAPIIHPDELGYVGSALYLARGGLRPEISYYPGYSLLLVPLWWASKDPITVWRGALVVNAGLAGLGGLVTWVLSSGLAPALSSRQRLAVTAVVCAYPALLLYSDLALAECLFVLVFGIVVLLAGRALVGRAPGWWGALGVASGALALVHPRGLAVVVAVVLMALLVLRPWKPASAVAGAALTAGLVFSLGVTRLLVHATGSSSLNNFAPYRPDTIISKSLSVHGAASLLWEAGGQLFYLSVATLGLAPLGLLLGLRALRSVVRGDRAPVNMIRAFAALSFLGVWALSSLYMNLGQRADKLIYGRYNEGAIVPLLVIGLADVLTQARVRRFAARSYAARRWLLVGVGGVGIGAGALIVGRTTAQLHGDLNPVNVLGIYPFIRHTTGTLDVALLACTALGGIIVLSLLAWRAPGIAAVLLVPLFLVAAVDSQLGYLVPGSTARANERVIAATVTKAVTHLGIPNDCIGYDSTTAIEFNYFSDRFLVTGRRFAWFDPTSGAQPCGPLVVSGRTDLATHFPGARRVTFENDVAQSLWVLPSPTQARLASAGWLLPDPTPGPLPDAARHAVLHAPGHEGTMTFVASGRTNTIDVRATHDGGGAPWPAEPGLKQEDFAVGLAARWYAPSLLPATAADPGHPIATTTVELPATLLPGETVTFHLPLSARGANGTPLAPGRYKVRLAVFQQQTPAFTDPGLTLDVTLT